MERSMLSDVLNAILPGRRRLMRSRFSRMTDTINRQNYLLDEFISLANVRTNKLDGSSLGAFDSSGFASYIRGTSADSQWKNARPRLAELELPEMSGGVNPGDQRLIFHLCHYLKPTRALEIGTHIGASTAHFAIALNGLDAAQSHLDTVDIKDVNCPVSHPWRAFRAKRSPREMVDALGCEKLVQFHVQDATTFLESHDAKYNLIFLDGDHSAVAVYEEVRLALSRLENGGVILLHDYFPGLRPLWAGGEAAGMMHIDVIPGVFLAIQRLINEGLRCHITPFGSLPWPTKLGSNVTSLALLSADC